MSLKDKNKEIIKAFKNVLSVCSLTGKLEMNLIKNVCKYKQHFTTKAYLADVFTCFMWSSMSYPLMN